MLVEFAKAERASSGTSGWYPTGRVTHDDRGNAVWEFRPDAPDVATLDAPGVRILDAAPTVGRGARHGQPARPESGYDPYESGPVDQTGFRRRRDLRALSHWIEQQKHGNLEAAA